MLLPLTGLVLACAALLAPGRVQGEPPADRRESLEAYLERARTRRSELMARLGPQVDALMAKAERAAAAGRREGRDSRDALVAEVAALGIEASPLVVRYLDAGDTPTSGKQECAHVAVGALLRTGIAPVIDDLLAYLREGSDAARIHSARALAAAPDDERVRPALIAAFGETTGASVRHGILKALIELGGPQNDELLSSVLASDDAGLVSLALGALKETGNAQAAEAVRAVLADSARGARHIPDLIGYYGAVPAAFGAPELKAAVALALGSAALDQRVQLLESLWQLWGGSNPDLHRALAPALASSETRIREAGLVTLARLGDRAARKEVLQSYDENVERNDRYPDAYARRAQLYARIGDDEAAIKDYQRALQAARNDGSPLPDVHAGLARAYARRGKLREAADVMIKGLSPAQRRALENDPDFKELAASKYGKDIFGR